MATDDKLRKIGGEAWLEADRNGDDPRAAERRALFEYGRQFEREHRAMVRAAAQRYAVVNAALNKKLSEWPEEDDRGDG